MAQLGAKSFVTGDYGNKPTCIDEKTKPIEGRGFRCGRIKKAARWMPAARTSPLSRRFCYVLRFLMKASAPRPIRAIVVGSGTIAI
jgi:hypothetical protein